MEREGFGKQFLGDGSMHCLALVEGKIDFCVFLVVDCGAYGEISVEDGTSF